MNYKEYLNQQQKEKKEENKITIQQASELMGVSEQHLRILLQRNLIDSNIGTCVKKEGKRRYEYTIYKKPFYDFIGKDKEKPNKLFIL